MGLLNHVAIASVHAAGSLTDTYDPSTLGAGQSVKAGTLFPPTAGRPLVALCGGQVTWSAGSVPIGWTLPTNGDYVANYGSYVFQKTAAGGDTLVSTHNGDGSWPTLIHLFEFDAADVFQLAGKGGGALKANGSTVVTTGLTGTYTFLSMAVTEWNSGTATWVESAGTEQSDFGVVLSGKGATMSVTMLTGQTAASQTIGHTCTGPTTTQQRMQAVITEGAPAPAPAPNFFAFL